VHAGDVLIGIPSTGLHTNGFSLARSILLKHFSLSSHFDELGGALGDALLKIHRSYLGLLHPLVLEGKIHALSHITGGGIVGNTVRVLPRERSLHVDWNAWSIPPIFSMIQRLGDVPVEDMRRTFNLGVGIIAIVSQKEANGVMETLRAKGESPFVMGEVR
jgi:phosphoribosylformylglycinamidine cyclo-ligase